ncbi:MAG: MFS transporter [Paludibacteraceae bacterium]|jgi:FHS family L-fucose permease-like MFS transporter|nr:MFS transporter [Paludibacteraceae bacterium]
MSSKQSNSLRIITIIAMMFLYAMIAFVTNLAAPVGKIWEQSFEGNHAQVMGMLGNMMNFLAYLIMGIPAGLMLSKIGYKKTALIAVAVGLLGVLVQWLSGETASFVVYLIGAFIAGFSVCMLNTVVNPLLTLMGGGGKKGNQLNLIGGTINSLSASLTPMLVGALVGASVAGKTIADVNTVLYIAMAVFAVVFIILYFTPIAEPEGAGQDVVYERTPWAFKHFVLGAVAIFLYVGIEVGIPATLISYLKDSLGFGVAGFIAGLYWLLMLVGRFVGSAIGGNVSSKTMVASVSAAAIVLIVAAMILGDTITIPFIGDWTFAIVNIPIAALLLVLCGLCTSIMWGCIFNLAVEGLGKYTAKASGIFMMMVVGGGIVPLIQSAVAGQFGEMISYIVPLVGVIYILYYALVGSKNVNTDIKID